LEFSGHWAGGLRVRLLRRFGVTHIEDCSRWAACGGRRALLRCLHLPGLGFEPPCGASCSRPAACSSPKGGTSASLAAGVILFRTEPFIGQPTCGV